MALVCPADHPPGVGTSFCRLCGRDYVEVPDPVVEAPAPPVTESVVPAQAPAPEPVAATPRPPAPVMATAPAAAPTAWPPAPAPVLPPVPTRPAPPVELVAVPATGGIQVHLPLVEHVPAPAPAPSQEAKPAPTDTHAVDFGGPTLTADEDEAEVEPVTEARAPRALDRTAVLVGTVAGFLGGAVSGAAVSLLLS